MKTIQYNDVSIPVIGLGTWENKGKECTDSVIYALDEVGYRHVDTAQAYENEEYVGDALAQSSVPRDQIFLTTKVWLENMHEGDLEKSVDQSLQKLKTDYCDLILIHWPHQDIDFDETLGALDKVRQKGKTRLMGISNFTVDQMKKVREDLGYDVAVNQCEYHPYIDQSPVLDYVRDQNMVFTCYSPIARGKVMKDDAIKAMAEKYGKNAAQIVLRWQIQQDRVITIPKSSSHDHIKANLDVFDFELDADDMNTLFNMAREDGRIVSPDFAPKWDTAKKAA